VELTVDPCSRSICTDSVAKSLELLGRSLRQAVIRTKKYTIRFGTVTVRTSTELAGQSYDDYRFEADEVVKASQAAGGGGQLVGRLQGAKESYPRAVLKEVSNRVKARRVSLSGVPIIRHDAKAVSVELEIRSDRVRFKSDVLAAMLGVAEALRKNPLTPPTQNIQVTAAVPFRTVEHRRFTCLGQALGLYLDGKMKQDEVWATYIVEKKKGGQQVTFDDAEAAGKSSGDDDGGSEDDRSGEILGAHMTLLAPCLTAEAARSRSFKGVTLVFSVSPAGQAVGLTLKEAASGSLRSCLQAALARIRFQRHGGGPRQVTYPMLIKR